MDVLLRYRGRDVCSSDITFVRALIAEHPHLSRRALSKKLCEAWNWIQPNGHLRDMVCRGLMLELHRSGLITLPPKRMTPHNPLVQRARPKLIEVAQVPLCSPLNEIGSVQLRQVRRSPEEVLVNSLIEQHHYLGYTQPVGEHLKYLVFAQDRPIACLAWSSAPRHLGPRDRFIGWSKQARLRNIGFLAYNTRFLILPWVRVQHLASHLLAQVCSALPGHWMEKYGHPIHLLETFVERERFRGTCYRAAGWTHVGATAGRSRNDVHATMSVPVKDVLVYPLTIDFRGRLCA